MLQTSRFWAFVEHPRTALVAALIVGALGLVAPGVAAYVLFGVAGLLVLRSAWEWQPIRSHIPFHFQSPVVLHREARPKPAPVALGGVDYELRKEKATAASIQLLQKMTKATVKGNETMEEHTAKLNKVAGADVQRRHRALERSGRAIEGFAKELGALEAQYRVQVTAMVDNAKEQINHASPGTDISQALQGVDEFRQSTASYQQSTLENQAGAQSNRDMNVSQAVNAGWAALVDVYQRIAEDAQVVIDYCDWVVAIVRERSTQTPPAVPPPAQAP